MKMDWIYYISIYICSWSNVTASLSARSRSQIEQVRSTRFNICNDGIIIFQRKMFGIYRPHCEAATKIHFRENWNNFRCHCGYRDEEQGIVHVIGTRTWTHTAQEKRLVCGDSHTATHGAFGALAFGIVRVKWNMYWRRKRYGNESRKQWHWVKRKVTARCLCERYYFTPSFK